MMVTVNGDSDDGDDDILLNLIMDTPSDYFITVDVNKKNTHREIQIKRFNQMKVLFFTFFGYVFFIACFSSNTDFRN